MQVVAKHEMFYKRLKNDPIMKKLFTVKDQKLVSISGSSTWLIKEDN